MCVSQQAARKSEEAGRTDDAVCVNWCRQRTKNEEVEGWRGWNNSLQYIKWYFCLRATALRRLAGSDRWMSRPLMRSERLGHLGFYLGLAAAGNQHNGFIHLHLWFCMLCEAIGQGRLIKKELSSELWWLIDVLHIFPPAGWSQCHERYKSVMCSSTCVGGKKVEEEEVEDCAWDRACVPYFLFTRWWICTFLT